MKSKIIVKGGCGNIGSHTATDLAKEKLGWEAELSLDEMISSSWNWEQKLRQED